MSDPFEKERDKQLAAMEKAEIGAVASILTLLNQLRSDIIARVAEAGDLESNVPLMRTVERQIGRQIDIFELEATRIIASELDKAFTAGVKLIDAPLLTLNIQPIAVGISPELVTVAQGFSADLITNLSNDVRTKSNSILRQSAMGALSLKDAIAAVGRSLESPGVFKSIAARAETIVRTETLRIYSQAADMRMRERARILKSAGYELRKSWLTAMDLRVRATHILAGALYAAPIPIDEPFLVGGESLRYPRDETASADETVNCRCALVPVVQRLAA